MKQHTRLLGLPWEFICAETDAKSLEEIKLFQSIISEACQASDSFKAPKPINCQGNGCSDPGWIQHKLPEPAISDI
jgi:hypothetical protein